MPVRCIVAGVGGISAVRAGGPRPLPGGRARSRQDASTQERFRLGREPARDPATGQDHHDQGREERVGDLQQQQRLEPDPAVDERHQRGHQDEVQHHAGEQGREDRAHAEVIARDRRPRRRSATAAGRARARSAGRGCSCSDRIAGPAWANRLIAGMAKKLSPITGQRAASSADSGPGEPHRRDVHRGDEGQRAPDRSSGSGKPTLRAQEATEGIGMVLRHRCRAPRTGARDRRRRRPRSARPCRASASPHDRCAGRWCVSRTKSRPAAPRPIHGQTKAKCKHSRKLNPRWPGRRRLQCIARDTRDGLSPHSCRKCPPSAISSGGGQLRMWACKRPHHRRAEHRVLHADRHQALAGPGVAPEVARLARERRARLRPAGRAPGWERRARPPCRRRRDRARHRPSPPRRRCAGRRASSAARCPCRASVGEGAPVEEALAQAARRRCPAVVFITSSASNRSGMAIGRVRPISPPQSCTTSAMLRRSSASMRSIRLRRWKSKV